MGRPPKPISAKQVEDLARMGHKNIDIAKFFEVSSDTIERRYAAELAKGRHSLAERVRTAQLRAMDQGNGTMLVWLGKQYLGQSDSTIDDYLNEAIKIAGITKEDLINLIQNKDKIIASQAKRSFEEFITKAGYPTPFAKQVEMKNFGMVEDVPRLLLGARNYGKTDYVTLMGVAYDIYINGPKISNLIISKSKTRNAAMIEEIANALKANGVSLAKQNSSCIRLNSQLGKDHIVEALTIKSSFRGRHPKRIIMDDPVTEEDTSEAMRVLVKKKYDEAYKLCKNLLIIGQPSHKYDLYADLRGIIKTMEVPHGSIPELDSDLEAMRLAGVDEASIQMSYHLKVTSEGSSPFENVKFTDKFPIGDCIAFIDPSFEGGDYTAVTIMRVIGGQSIFVIGKCYKKGWNHCLDDMVPEFMKYGVKRIAFETNALGDQPIIMLRQLMPGMGVIGLKSNTNKHSRIMSAGAYAHIIHLSKESDKVYIDQVVKYEYKAKHDDAPDSLASALTWLGYIRGKE